VKKWIQKAIKKIQNLGIGLPPWAIPFLLASLGTFFLYQGISNYKEKLGLGMKVRDVVVANREMPEGYVVQDGDLGIAQLPEKYLPIGGLLKNDAPQAIGHAVIRPISRGELVLWSALDVGFAPTGPARRITKGYRALAVSVSSVTSAAHSIRSGDHVDLVTTTSMPGEIEQTTLTLLQNVAVLDVGNPRRGDHHSYSTVTLMVLPQEVVLITFAQQHGSLTLALRNPEDHQTPSNLSLIGRTELVESAFRNSLQEERNRRIEIIRGGKLSFDRNSP